MESTTPLSCTAGLSVTHCYFRWRHQKDGQCPFFIDHSSFCSQGWLLWSPGCQFGCGWSHQGWAASYLFHIFWSLRRIMKYWGIKTLILFVYFCVTYWNKLLNLINLRSYRCGHYQTPSCRLKPPSCPSLPCCPWSGPPNPTDWYKKNCTWPACRHIQSTVLYWLTNKHNSSFFKNSLY